MTNELVVVTNIVSQEITGLDVVGKLKDNFDKIERILSEENKTGFLTAMLDKISSGRKAAAKREKETK
jgi:hypothetical protein